MKLLYIVLLFGQLFSAGTAECETAGKGASLKYPSASLPNRLDHCIFADNLCSPRGDVEGGGTQGSERVGPRRSTPNPGQNPVTLCCTSRPPQSVGPTSGSCAVARRSGSVNRRSSVTSSRARWSRTVAFPVGTRVGVCPSIPCGRCAPCLRSGENLCPDQQAMEC